jgi:hypothetical protein
VGKRLGKVEKWVTGGCHDFIPYVTSQSIYIPSILIMYTTFNLVSYPYQHVVPISVCRSGYKTGKRPEKDRTITAVDQK